ncbi:MAG: thiL [Chloroflexi bacterium]|nr:thiL [Chloroflexota bacterium]
MAVASIGEFELIDRLIQRLRQTRSDGLLIGIGDDAAAWKPSSGCLTVATTDSLVEGVHFDLATTSWRDLGWKALAENVSDIAAMGCEPRYALIALALRGASSLVDVEELYEGIGACAEAYHFAVVGGDVVQSTQLAINVTLLGESMAVQPGSTDRPLLERSMARVGDVIAVTGPLGGSAAGLRLLLEGRADDDAAHRDVLEAHRRPKARVVAGRTLVEAGIRCGIDVSDGLVADVGHLCERSGCDAEIDADHVPVHPGARAAFGDEAIDLALSGGEDYELVCAGSADALARAGKLLRQRGEPPLTLIGSMVTPIDAGGKVRVRSFGGALMNLDREGYQHFDENREPEGG